jgi:Fic-DOC domain mobile mystery protein B
MTDLFDADEGQTELTPDEKKGLKPAYITYRVELNEAEQENILKAELWFAQRKHPPAPLALADQAFICSVHKRMYQNVWEWAGTYRTSDRNIGVDYYLIREEMAKFIGDAQWWIQNQTFQPDELAVRFHHRLVWIHPFPNGNGRLSRLLADHLATRLGAPRFTWGKLNLINAGNLRTAYIAALRKADNGDITELLAFARS